MRKLNDRLHDLDRQDIQGKWRKLEGDDGLSTREKLDKLVRQNLKRNEKAPAPPAAPAREAAAAAQPSWSRISATASMAAMARCACATGFP